MVELRPYQIEGIRKIFEAWDPSKLNLKNVLFQMPTGTGKTTVFSQIVKKAQEKEKKVLIVAHRIELIDQISERLDKFDVKAGIISAKRTPEPALNVQVATIQTLVKRTFPPADIVIIDECHHALANTYKKLWEVYPEARFLGVTATPWRLNGQGFDKQFDILIPLGKLSEFIQQNFLAKIKHLVCGIPDISKVELIRQDYDVRMLSNIMLNNSIMAGLVESYKKFALGKKTIVFAVDIEHSLSIEKRYIEAGISAAHIDGDTHPSKRKEILDKFKTGEIQVLTNVDIVSEGFDVPNCEAVQLARPSKSLALYLQQVGRCMRPVKGKDFGLILDNAGLWIDHGISYIDREWRLDARKKKKGQSDFARNVVIDNEGAVREVSTPNEAEGLELVEITAEIERLLIFESFISNAKQQEYKISWVAYKYTDYLYNEGLNYSEYEISYCHNRFKQEGCNYLKGFWYRKRQEIEDRFKADREDKSKSVKAVIEKADKFLQRNDYSKAKL